MPVVAGFKHPGAAMLLFGGFSVAGAGAVVSRKKRKLKSSGRIRKKGGDRDGLPPFFYLNLLILRVDW